jgi:transposase InsO family protein
MQTTFKPFGENAMPPLSGHGCAIPRWAADTTQDQLVHHWDRGPQYLSIKHTERLAGAKIAPSVGSVGDFHDNALGETIKGLFKAEVIHIRGPWRNFEAVECAALERFGHGRVTKIN